MILEEFKRYFISKFNIVLFFASILVIVFATWQNYSEKQEFVQHLSTTYSYTDIEFLTMMVDGWTGTFLFERLFFLNTDYYTIFWMVLMIGIGIHIGADTFWAVQSNYGTMLITRMSYRKYLKNTLLAQLLYMATFISIIFASIFIGLVFFGGGGFQISPISRAGDLSTASYFFVLLGLVVYSIICMIPLILISSLSSFFLKNKYIIQFIPICILLGSYILGFILGNVSMFLSLIFRQFIFEHALSMLTSVISPYVTFSDNQQTIEILAFVIIYPSLLFVVVAILYKKNISQLGENYIS